MTLLHLTLLLLATARLTRLVTTDVILETPRVRFLRWRIRRTTRGGRKPVNEGGRLAYLIVCDWCSSIYVGAAVTGAWWAWGDTMWLMMVYAALSASYVTGFLASKTEG